MLGERGATNPAKRDERRPFDMLGVVFSRLSNIHKHGLFSLKPVFQRCGIDVFYRHRVILTFDLTNISSAYSR